ncbi:hypothetical protein ABSA28_00845 [Candidatus Hepatincolaceae symbiont of Richtersius coronifer]
MQNDIRKDFEDRLKFIINKKFKTQTAFSQKFNSNRVNLNNWITGRGQHDC